MNPEILISPLEVNEIMASEGNVLLLDVRSNGNYRRGHIKGAYNVFRSSYLTSNGNYGGMNISREKAAEMLGELGATSQTLIIAYDDLMGIDAARLWWLLDMYGHHNFKMIDGGYQNWEEFELPLTREAPPPRSKTNYSFPQNADFSRLASFSEVLSAKNNSSIMVLDVRSRGEYSGALKLGGARTRGAIPWAQWFPHSSFMNSGNIADKSILPADELRELLEANNITSDKTIILYCHSSIRATVPTLVLTELLGYPKVKIFDDGWMGWSYMNSLYPETYPVKLGD